MFVPARLLCFGCRLPKIILTGLSNMWADESEKAWLDGFVNQGSGEISKQGRGVVVILKSGANLTSQLASDYHLALCVLNSGCRK